MKLIDIKDEFGWQYNKDYPKTKIAKTTTIGRDAWVADNAKVSENATIYGNAIIRGNAQLYENAVVAGHSEVFGNAIIDGDGEILKTEDYMVIESPNRFFRHITLHRDKKIGIRISSYSYFYFSGTLQEYIFRHRKLNNQYFHHVMMTKYYEQLRDRMTPL